MIRDMDASRHPGIAETKGRRTGAGESRKMKQQENTGS
jgi:hypothetical protein